MKKLKVNEETWELEEIEVPDSQKNNEISDMIKDETTSKEYINNAIVQDYLCCSPKEFIDKYKAYKKAKSDFDMIFELTKSNLLELYKTDIDIGHLPSTITVGDIKLTYVSPSIRTSIDSKKLKEEEPEIAKKYSKHTKVDATIRIS